MKVKPSLNLNLVKEDIVKPSINLIGIGNKQSNRDGLISSNSVNLLQKGQRTALSKLAPNANNVRICVGWEDGRNYDMDLSAFMLNSSGRALGDSWFIFYGNKVSLDNSLIYRELANDKEEAIDIDLTRVDSVVERIVFVLTIHEALERGYNFSGVSNVYVSLQSASNIEMARFSVTEYYSSVTAMMLVELYRKNGEWRIVPIGDGKALDLSGLCAFYGIDTE